MKKIAVYYIATNKYIGFFDGFMKCIVNFFPDIKKKVVLITDCDEIDHSKANHEDIELVQFHIDHHYWPIPTLFKMFYIEKFFQDDCDYHFYFNANLYIKKPFDFDKYYDLYLMRHYWCPDISIPDLTRNNNCVKPPEWAECNIRDEEIPKVSAYVQGGFFGGKTESMKRLLGSVNEMLRVDLVRNVIASWHDETYLNKYILKNYWIHNNIGDVKVISMPEYADLVDRSFDKYKL